MPKAGSSTIQTWLRENIAVVRDELNFEPLVFRRGRPGDASDGLVRHRGVDVNSGGFLFRYLISDRDPSIVSQLTERLDRYAHEHDRVLVTSEAFATLFAELDLAFLEGLERLADEHNVRVAYYVRAQHESLEAAWRQWGFRSGRTPSDYIRFRQRLLHYDRTCAEIARIAPHLSFEVRRFPPGGSRDDSIVDDFVRTFLGATRSVDSSRTWANPGLPLELVNTLRCAPAGWFWRWEGDNPRLDRIKDLAARVSIAETPEAGESRRLLHRYCHDRFESGNRAMAEQLGWPRRDLIPEVLDSSGPAPDLAALDSLWECKRNDDERMVLYRALRDAVESEGSGKGRDTADDKAAIDELVRFFDASPIDSGPRT